MEKSKELMLLCTRTLGRSLASALLREVTFQPHLGTLASNQLLGCDQHKGAAQPNLADGEPRLYVLKQVLA